MMSVRENDVQTTSFYSACSYMNAIEIVVCLQFDRPTHFAILENRSPIVSLEEADIMKACLDSIPMFSGTPERLMQAVFRYLAVFPSSPWRWSSVQNSISHCKRRRKRLKLCPIIVHAESV